MTAVRDPGLQGERTALAWNRTALSIGVNALLVLRAGWSSGPAAVSALALALLLAAVATAVIGAWRRKRLVHGDAPIASHGPLIAGVSIAAVATCVIGAISVVTTR